MATLLPPSVLSVDFFHMGYFFNDSSLQPKFALFSRAQAARTIRAGGKIGNLLRQAAGCRGNGVMCSGATQTTAAVLVNLAAKAGSCAGHTQPSPRHRPPDGCRCGLAPPGRPSVPPQTDSPCSSICLPRSNTRAWRQCRQVSYQK